MNDTILGIGIFWWQVLAFSAGAALIALALTGFSSAALPLLVGVLLLAALLLALGLLLVWRSRAGRAAD